MVVFKGHNSYSIFYTTIPIITCTISPAVLYPGISCSMIYTRPVGLTHPAGANIIQSNFVPEFQTSLFLPLNYNTFRPVPDYINWFLDDLIDSFTYEYSSPSSRLSHDVNT